MSEHQIITLSGRRYRVVERPTFMMQVHLSKLAERGKLVDPMPRQDENPDAFALRVVHAADEAGVLFLLLGAVLLPEGVSDVDWTAEQAEATARVIATLQDESEIARARLMIAEVLLPFIRAGLASFSSTRSASLSESTSAGVDQGSSPSSASGTERSARSRGGIPRIFAWFSRGRSRTHSVN